MTRAAIGCLALAGALAAAPAAPAAPWSAPREVAASGFPQRPVVDAAGRVTLLWSPAVQSFQAAPPAMIAEGHVNSGPLRRYRLAPSSFASRLGANEGGLVVAAWVAAPRSCTAPFGCEGDLRVAAKRPERRFGRARTVSRRVFGVPAIAVNARGDVVVAATRRRGAGRSPRYGEVVVATRAGGATAWRSHVAGDAGVAPGQPPGLALAPDGSAVVAWTRHENRPFRPSDVFATSRRGHGRFGARRRLARDSGFGIAAILDRFGRALAVWQSGSRFPPRIYSARRTAGDAWSAAQVLGEGANVMVGSDTAGGAVALWSRPTGIGSGFDMEPLAARRAPGASFSAPTRILPPNARAALAVGPGGHAVVAWATGTSEPMPLRIADLAASGPVGGGQLVAPSAGNFEPSLNRRGAGALAFTVAGGTQTPVPTRVMLSTRRD